jgi:ferritin-like metal-binding protein YciE
MIDQRQDLLNLLRDAYALAQNVEQLLRQFYDRLAGRAMPVSAIEACLQQSLDQQRLLGECLRRIEGDGQVPRSNNVLPAAVQQSEEDQSTDDAHDDLSRVRALILQEMDVCSSCIAAAESSGFFETKLACERILSQKSAMAARLSRDDSSHANLNIAAGPISQAAAQTTV